MKGDFLTIGWDVQVLGTSKILLTEWNCVSERDWGGKLCWEREFPSVVVRCQRLRNGNTFIATHSNVQELEPDGKVVYRLEVDSYILDAEKLDNGNIVYLQQGNGKVLEITTSGTLIRSFRSGVGLFGTFSLLSNHRFLVTQEQEDKVVEVDTDGKVFWSCDAELPTSAVRMANGNTLIGSRFKNYVMEVDRTGTVIWKKKTNGGIWRIRLVPPSNFN